MCVCVWGGTCICSVCVYLCVPACMSLCAPHMRRCAWRPEGIGTLELRVVVSHLIWPLRTEPRSSAEAASAHLIALVETAERYK